LNPGVGVGAEAEDLAEKLKPPEAGGAGAEDLAEMLNPPEAGGAGAGADGMAEKLKLLEAEGAGAGRREGRKHICTYNLYKYVHLCMYVNKRIYKCTRTCNVHVYIYIYKYIIHTIYT
jgi:hypothetical protein